MAFEQRLDWPVTRNGYHMVLVSDSDMVRVYDGSGRLLYRSHDHDDAIDYALERAPNRAHIKLLGDFTIKLQHVAVRDTVLDGYGARFVAGASHTAIRMIMPDSNVKLHIKGLKMELKGIWGVATGATIDRVNATLILEDVEITGVYNYGVSQTADGSTLIIKRSRLEAVQPDGSQNELVLAEDHRLVVLEDVELLGNKPMYLTGEKITVRGVEADTSPFNTHYWSPMHGRKIMVESCWFDSASIALRPYGDVHLDVVYAPAELIVVRDCVFLESAGTSRIYLHPYDETFDIRTVVVSGVRQQKTPIYVKPWSGKGRIRQLVVENVSFAEYSAGAWVVDVDDTDIDMLVINNVRMPDSSLPTSSIIDLGAVNYDITVNAYVRGVHADPLPNYSVSFRDDGSGRRVDGRIDVRGVPPRPLRRVTASVIVGAQVLMENSDVATIAAGSTRVTVSHKLPSAPSKIYITPLAQPPGRLWVENITDESFDIVTDVAPSSGLPVAWRAEV